MTVSYRSVSAQSPLLDNAGIENVELRDTWLSHANHIELEYMLELRPERFLVGFYHVAGIPVPTDSSTGKAYETYGGWERESGINFRSHAFGHYMSALSQLYRNVRDTSTRSRIAARIGTAIEGLDTCQKAWNVKHADRQGFISAFPEVWYGEADGLGGEGLIDKGKDNVFVPYYNLHKVMAGLVDIATFGPKGEATKAERIAWAMGVYLSNRIVGHASKSRMLATEYGGMNEALYRLYDITGDERILAAAQMFDETSLFETFADKVDVRTGKNIDDGRDALSGKHANTTIPKFIGALTRYHVLTQNPAYYARLSQEEKDGLAMYKRAAERFFAVVLANHTYVQGGNSQSEHFHDAGRLYEQAELQTDYQDSLTDETCNVYNMLKLARELYRTTRDVRYMDYYERAYTNQILASQNPETGTTTYFQPMASGFFRVYGTRFDNFWCCTGTGFESMSKLGDSIYFTDRSRGGRNVYVNMFLSTVYRDVHLNLRLTQTTDMPTTDLTTFTIEALDGGALAEGTTLRLRVPYWAAGPVTINGSVAMPQDGYVSVEVQAGDVLTYEIPMAVRLDATQDNGNYVAFSYGPVTLSADEGTWHMDPANSQKEGTVLGQGVGIKVPMRDPNATKFIVVQGDLGQWKKNIAKNLVRVADRGGQVAFVLNNVVGSASGLVFTPHYRNYNVRYGLYFYLTNPDSAEMQRVILRRKNDVRKDEVSVDALTTFDNNNSEMGKNAVYSSQDWAANGALGSYREFTEPGQWVTYDLRCDPNSPNYLVRRYDTTNGFSHMHVSVNGHEIAIDSTKDESSPVYQPYMEAVKVKEDKYDVVKIIDPRIIGEAKTTSDGGPRITVKFQIQGSSSDPTDLYGVFVRTADTSAKDDAAGYTSESEITGLSVDGGTISPTLATGTYHYRAVVPADAQSASVTIAPATASGLIRVRKGNDIVLIDDSQPREVSLNATGDTVLSFVSYAQDRRTSTAYTLRITRRS